MTETQGKILDTAERLFGDQGYAGTSLRQIIAAAGVNLAAIHYHFGSKEELLDHLVMRKAGPVNAERLAMLDRCQAEAGSAPVTVEKILRAFLEPPLLRVKENPDFAKLMGRLYGEGLMPAIVEKHFQPVLTRFLAAFARALPRLSASGTGAAPAIHGGGDGTQHVVCLQPGIPGQPVAIDGAALLRELLAFATGGLSAPAALEKNTEESQ